MDLQASFIHPGVSCCGPGVPKRGSFKQGTCPFVLLCLHPKIGLVWNIYGRTTRKLRHGMAELGRSPPPCIGCANQLLHSGESERQSKCKKAEPSPRFSRMFPALWWITNLFCNGIGTMEAFVFLTAMFEKKQRAEIIICSALKTWEGLKASNFVKSLKATLFVNLNGVCVFFFFLSFTLVDELAVIKRGR